MKRLAGTLILGAIISLQGCGEEKIKIPVAEAHAKTQLDMDFQASGTDIYRDFLALGLGQDQYNDFVSQTENAGFDFSEMELVSSELDRIVNVFYANFETIAFSTSREFWFEEFSGKREGRIGERFVSILIHSHSESESCGCPIDITGTVKLPFSGIGFAGPALAMENLEIDIKDLTISTPKTKVLITDSHIHLQDYSLQTFPFTKLGGDPDWPTIVKSALIDLVIENNNMEVSASIQGTIGELQVQDDELGSAVQLISPDISIDLSSFLLE